MKTQDLDNELKNLIKGIRLDSPGNNFTANVMNRVFEEKAAMEKVKEAPLVMTIPLCVVAVLSILIGIFPDVIMRMLTSIF